MNEKDFQPNSHKYKEEQRKATSTPAERKVEKVVSGTVTTKKKNGIQKFADAFVSEDVVNIKSFILSDVIIPAIKNVASDTVGTIVDVIKNSVDTCLYGEAGARKKSNSSKISYRDYYESNKRRAVTEPKTRSSSRYDYEDIILDNRGEAEEVLSQMIGMVDTYKMVSVADLYDLVGITCNYTDNKYGWTDLEHASVIRVREGYMIKLPRAVPLD